MVWPETKGPVTGSIKSVRSLVLRWGPTVHVLQLSCWPHDVNPSRELCNTVAKSAEPTNLSIQVPEAIQDWCYVN